MAGFELWGLKLNILTWPKFLP